MTGHPANAADGADRRAAITGAGLVAFLLALAIVGLNGIVLIALLVAGPLLASSAATEGQTAAVGAWAAVAGTVMGAMNDGISNADHLVALIAVVLGSALAVSIVRARGLVAEEHGIAVEQAASREVTHLAAESRRVLESAQEPVATLTELSALAVPEVADLCFADLLQTDGTFAEVAVTAADQGAADELRGKPRYVLDLESEHPIPACARGGDPVAIAALTDEVLYSFAGGPERFDVLVGLGATSGLLVPLVARGRPLGVLSFLRVGDRDPFGEVDVEIADDLAGRTALALDNLRLAAAAERPTGPVEAA